MSKTVRGNYLLESRAGNRNKKGVGNLEKWYLWRGVLCGPWKQNYSKLSLHPNAFFYTTQTLPRSMVLPALYWLLRAVGQGHDRIGVGPVGQGGEARVGFGTLGTYYGCAMKRG
jgi:hypothetical protein